MARELGHDVECARFYDELVMLRRKALGDRPRVAKLIKLFIGKTDREGSYRPAGPDQPSRRRPRLSRFHLTRKRRVETR